VVNGYGIILEATSDNRLIFSREEPWIQIHGYSMPKTYSLGKGHEVARVSSDSNEESGKVSRHVTEKLKIWRQYHFHDTSDTAAVKSRRPINETLRLLPDAANLAAYLHKLKTAFGARYAPSYERIVDTIRRVAPFFGDFVFREEESEFIELEWTERGKPDTPWKAHMLSDGTLRFMCLTTLLLQPDYLLPDTILIDEPELGLHPFAINLLADMLQQAAETRQIIVSTQSVELLNALNPEDVVVVQRKQDQSLFNRLNTEELADWLADDYGLGELWKRNILGGRPSR
jgi:predicted ATPase